MNMRLPGIAALFFGSLIALPASAQQIKPGLWEINNTVGSGNGLLQGALAQLQQQLADMGPEERKTLEQMMANQGVQLGGLDGGGLRTRMCMTPEMAARSELPVQQQGDCIHKRSPARGGAMKVSFTCTNPRASGEGEVAFTGDSGYRIKMKIHSAATGSNETVTVDADAKWLGADCGNVKPFAIPAAK